MKIVGVNPAVLVGLVLAGGAVVLLVSGSSDLRLLGQRLSDLSAVISPVLLAASVMFFAVPVLIATNHGKVLRSGTPATAVVVEMRDTGVTVDGNPVLRLVLDVLRSGRPARRVTTRQAIPQPLASTLTSGTMVPVRTGSRLSSRVAVDLRPEGPGATTAGSSE